MTRSELDYIGQQCSPGLVTIEVGEVVADSLSRFRPGHGLRPKSGYNQDHRILFSATASSATDDPPLQSYQRSDNWFNGVNFGSFSRRLGSGGTEALRSNIALVSAWDATTSRTIFVGVDTGRTWQTQGEITVYPGFDGTSEYILAEGETLSRMRPVVRRVCVGRRA